MRLWKDLLVTCAKQGAEQPTGGPESPAVKERDRELAFACVCIEKFRNLLRKLVAVAVCVRARMDPGVTGQLGHGDGRDVSWVPFL